VAKNITIERNRALPVELVDALFETLGPIDGLQVLEVDCGAGATLRDALDRGAETWGVDPSVELLWEARGAVPEANLRDGHAADLPFDSCSFDAVYSFARRDSADAATAYLLELARVCKVGGLVAIPFADDDTGRSDFVASQRDGVAIKAGLWPLASGPTVMVAMKVFRTPS
jgi:ubiquinone/menaquinone biosynthesis C-methylase UbiE